MKLDEKRLQSLSILRRFSYGSEWQERYDSLQLKLLDANRWLKAHVVPPAPVKRKAA